MPRFAPVTSSWVSSLENNQVDRETEERKHTGNNFPSKIDLHLDGEVRARSGGYLAAHDNGWMLYIEKVELGDNSADDNDISIFKSDIR